MSGNSEPDAGVVADIVMVTFDALRYDVAVAAWEAGQTPFLRNCLPEGWECRQTPGTFTYAAHAAFFAGFWPTPTAGELGTRPFALDFPGSRTVGPETMLLRGDNIVSGFRQKGYHTICIGGVGFFNPATPLGGVLPKLFEQSYWRPEFSVTELHSAREQIEQACRCVAEHPAKPLFLFVNISATHPPTRGYLPESRHESPQTQAAALGYVDRQLPRLFEALRQRPRAGIAYLLSDHGTLFGEDGRTGHRVAHPLVWTVPYGEYRWGVTR